MLCRNTGKARTTTHKLAFLTPLFFLLLSFIAPVQGSDVNFTELPNQFAEAVGISLFASQILVSGIVLLMTVLPIAIITRGKSHSGWIAELIVGFVFLGFTIAVGWLPYWFLIILGMLIALMFSGTMRNLITGSGK